MTKTKAMIVSDEEMRDFMKRTFSPPHPVHDRLERLLKQRDDINAHIHGLYEWGVNNPVVN